MAFGRPRAKSRKRCGPYIGSRLPAFISMFIVYILVGFWHGSSWKYVAYGIWNGIFIMSGILLDGPYAKLRKLCRIQEETATWRVFQAARTFVIVSFGRFFSRGFSLTTALQMFRRTFQNWRDISFLTNGALLKLGLNTANWVMLVGFLLVLFYVDYIHEKGVHVREAIDRQSLVFRWLIYIAAVLVILVFGVYGPQYDAASFIYQQF